METLTNIQPVISLIISVATLIGIAIAIYKFSSDPDKKAFTEIQLLKQSFGLVKEDVRLIKVNHLPHIEDNLKSINGEMIRIATMLDERLPGK